MRVATDADERKMKMKLVKTAFKLNVNDSSSWIVYITKDLQKANDIHNIALTQESMFPDGWYHTISTCKVNNDCRVPEFFHGGDYIATVIEHNQGDWNRKPTYELYIVE